MILETERLILRKWTQDDAESLFTYAKNPKVGPIAGWPPHKDIESSKYVIDNIFTGAECYAICEKENLVVEKIRLSGKKRTLLPVFVVFPNTFNSLIFFPPSENFI